MLKRWFKRTTYSLRGWLLNYLLQEEEDWHIISSRLKAGDTLEQKAEYWRLLDNWFDSVPGRAFIEQQEVALVNLQQALLAKGLETRDDRHLAILVAKIQQQNKITSFHLDVKQRAQALEGRFKAKVEQQKQQQARRG